MSMTIEAAVASALHQAGISSGIAATHHLSGGCIHQVIEVTVESGVRFVAKVNRAAELSIFEEEAHSLDALRESGCVLVPDVLVIGSFDGHALLMMRQLPPAEADEAAWRTFGESLASLHTQRTADRYGFDIDNHLGLTFQPNAWADDWVEFNARNRLGFQIDLADQHARLDDRERDRLHRVVDRLADFIPGHPRASLLHGDLWSGNALPTAGPAGRPVIALIDPACSYGDGWADIAMMRLFGGFPDACFGAYAAAADDHDGVDARVAVYQLYHVLNHVNLFGRSYIPRMLSLLDALGC